MPGVEVEPSIAEVVLPHFAVPTGGDIRGLLTAYRSEEREIFSEAILRPVLEGTGCGGELVGPVLCNGLELL